MRAEALTLVVVACVGLASCRDADPGKKRTGLDPLAPPATGVPLPAREGDKPAALLHKPVRLPDGGLAAAAAREALKVGMSRQAFLEHAQGCARQIYLAPGGGKVKSSEIFQPRDKGCVEALGARRFVVVGDRVEQIIDGVENVPAPGAPRARAA